MNVRRRSSVHMEEIDDDDDIPQNVAPANKSCILERTDGSDTEMDIDVPPLVPDDDEDDDDDSDTEEEEEAEESAEAELGQPLP